MKINNEQLHNKVNDLLNKLRPHLELDGGNIEINSISSDNTVTLKWIGSCAKCERSEVTFKYCIKDFLLKEIPELKDVIEL